MSTQLRRARPGDEVELTRLVHELAAFEGAAAACTVTVEQLRRAMFADPPLLSGHLAVVDGRVAAAALWFVTFSTWDGEGGIYLEDLYVRPAFRRRGLAKALLAALAAECVARGFTRLSWVVLDWNADAVALYEAVGGRAQREWLTYRLSGPALGELAGSAPADG